MKRFSFKYLTLLAASCCLLLSALDAPAQSSSKATAASSEKKKKPTRFKKWPYKFGIPMSSHLESAPKRGDKSEELIYETENFVFHSPVHLSRKARERLARIFECGLEANMVLSHLLPIVRMETRREILDQEAEVQAALPKGEKFESKRPKLHAYLYKTMQDYYAAGGPQGSAGVYRYSFSQRIGADGRPAARGVLQESDLGMDIVLVPLESMGIKEDGKVEERTVDSHVLVHELTHQCTVLNPIPIWINEGLSEYVGYISTKSYSLNFSTSPKRVQAEVKRVAASGAEYPFSLEDFFSMSQSSFSRHMGNGVNTYLLAAVTTTYFMDLTGEKGRKKLVSYLTALNEGVAQKKALEKLLDEGDTFEDLEKDLIKRVKKLKLKLKFNAE